MASIWEFIINIFRKDTTSSDDARDRLKLVLRQDRVKITPEAMDEIRKDILQTISEYVEIEEENLQLNIAYNGNDTSIIASMPVRGGRAEITGKKRKEFEMPTASKKKPAAKKPAAKKKVVAKKKPVAKKKVVAKKKPVAKKKVVKAKK